ncbi:MAG: HD-GYP domain-containing protein [Bacillota bacterium]
MKRKLKIFLGFVYILFGGVFIFLLHYRKETVQIPEIIFFVLVLFLCSNLSTISNTGKDIVTSINLPILMTVMPLGSFWTGIIALIGTIKLYQLKTFDWYKFLFNQTVIFMASAGGSAVFNIINQTLDSSFLIIPFLGGALTYFIINNGLVYMVISISQDKGMSSIFIYYLELIKNLIPSFFMGLMLFYGYIYLGKIIFVLGIILIYIMKDFLFTKLQMINSFTQIVESFLKVIDSKDHYTEGHCKRVAEYADILGEALNLRKGQIDRIINMAKIHDIGKIYVDDEILKKSDKLSKAEYEAMKKHSKHGYDLLEDIDLMKEDLDIILYHHERFDGDGYPEGVGGEEIPLGARVLSVCDAFDVMVTGRTYKPALNKKEVIKELKVCSGSQFDPEIAGEMVELIEKGVFDKVFQQQEEREEVFYQQIKSVEVNE